MPQTSCSLNLRQEEFIKFKERYKSSQHREPVVDFGRSSGRGGLIIADGDANMPNQTLGFVQLRTPKDMLLRLQQIMQGRRY